MTDEQIQRVKDIQEGIRKKHLTLEDAKKETFDKAEQGITCPCCEQYVKIYTRKLNTAMALYLIRLYNLGEGSHHVSTIKGESTGSGDFSKLKYYEFIEEETNEDTSKRTSGMWKITSQGKKFALNQLKVYSHFKLYNGELLGFLGDMINIKEALGEKFNYIELMANNQYE